MHILDKWAIMWNLFQHTLADIHQVKSRVGLELIEFRHLVHLMCPLVCIVVFCKHLVPCICVHYPDFDLVQIIGVIMKELD